jgi:bifunctional UDP-N-acetylglucosamine pyrophosphorylase/glucosamine-1-phosphate N-acetyltransferase
MLPVANKPILEHLIISLRGAGITNIYIVVGYKEREIRNYFFSGEHLGVNIKYITQYEQSGTGSAVLRASDVIDGEFVVVNGDTIFDTLDIDHIIRASPNTIGICKSNNPQQYGVVGISDNRATSLVEKPDIPNSKWVNTGIYHFDRDIFKLLEDVPVSERGEIEITSAISAMIKEGLVDVEPIKYWKDVSYPWDLIDLNQEFIRETPREDRIDSSVTMDHFTVISSDVIIGKNVRIGPHVYIRPGTTIGDNCRIGHASEVKNSIIMHDTNIPHFNYIGDSIIGSGCNIGAGTKIANFRFDKKDIRVAGVSTHKTKFGAIIGDNVNIGINCSVNAGSVIGSDVNIYPHTYITGSFGVRNHRVCW